MISIDTEELEDPAAARAQRAILTIGGQEFEVIHEFGWLHHDVRGRVTIAPVFPSTGIFRYVTWCDVRELEEVSDWAVREELRMFCSSAGPSGSQDWYVESAEEQNKLPAFTLLNPSRQNPSTAAELLLMVWEDHQNEDFRSIHTALEEYKHLCEIPQRLCVTL